MSDKHLDPAYRYKGELPAMAPDQPEVPKPTPGHKDTRRWCRGKVGREHQPVIVRPTSGWRRPCEARPEWAGWSKRNWWCFHREVCQVCGKVLRHSLPDSECPDLAA